MQKILAAALLAAGLVLSQLAWAEDKIADVTNMDALRAAVRADKKEFVASTLKLTPAEVRQKPRERADRGRRRSSPGAAGDE